MKLTLAIMIVSFSFAGLVSATIVEQQIPNSIALSVDTILKSYVGLIVFFGIWVQKMDAQNRARAEKMYNKIDSISKRLDGLNCNKCEVDK